MTNLPMPLMVVMVATVAMVRDYALLGARIINPRAYTPLHRSARLFISYGVLVTFAAPGVSVAAQWRIEPRLQLSETYTDNVNLTPASQRQSDFITEIAPGVFVQARSGKSEVVVTYVLQNLIYATDKDRNSVNHLLAANGKTELIPDRLFFEARANVSQQNVSLLGPVGVGSTRNDRNTSEVRTYTLTPYFVNNLGSTLSYEARYQHDYAGSDTDQLSASSADKVILAARSGTAFNRFGWGLNYRNEVVKYRSAGDTRLQSVSADFRYALNPRFAVLTTVGYEKNDFAFVGPDPVGRFWNAGFAWQPSSLTKLTATGGERFFGKTYALNYNHRSRFFFWSANYSENITSARSNLLIPSSVNTFSFLDAIITAQIPDPIERAKFVNDFIISRGLPNTLFTATNFFTNRTFLEKNFTGSVAFNTPKTTSIFNLYRVDRSASIAGVVATNFFGTDDFINSSNLLQKGASLLFNWRFAPKTGIDFGGGLVNTSFRGSGRQDDLRYVRLGLRHQLRPRVIASVDLRRLERDSNDVAGNYKENAVTAALDIRF